MNRFHRLLQGFAFAAAFGFLLLLVCGGLLVINPPYGLEAAMKASAVLIAPKLEARIGTHWIAGSE